MKVIRFGLVVFLIISTLILKAQTRDFNLVFKVKGIANDTALFAYNYGDKKFIRDSLFFDSKGVATLKGNKDYQPGVYLVAFPSLGNTYFELILKETNFELSTDVKDFLGSMTIRNSIENQIFYDDVRFMTKVGKEIDSLKKGLEDLEQDDPQRAKRLARITALNEEIRTKRNDVINKHPKLLYTKLLQAMMEIPIPDAPLGEDGKPDPAFSYYYLKAHYFDGVDFSDSGLIRTPVLLPKIMRYMDDMIIPMPDSIIVACDMLIAKASVNQEMYRVVLSELLNKYAKSTIMGQEKVYVHLIDKYYGAGKTPWVDEETLNKMKERAAALRPTLIGNKAPDMNVYSLDGQIINLYKSIANNKYTILAFWNSECSHCKKEIPEIRKLWQDSLQAMNVGVFSVSTEVEKEYVEKFIKDNQLEAWTNGYDPTGRMPFRKLYDLIATPVVIILDEKMEIIAKKIAVKDIKYVIDSHSAYMEARKKE
jgi:thiol-disulfide isomerase/thioredoxin